MANPEPEFFVDRIEFLPDNEPDQAGAEENMEEFPEEYFEEEVEPQILEPMFWRNVNPDHLEMRINQLRNNGLNADIILTDGRKLYYNVEDNTLTEQGFEIVPCCKNYHPPAGMLDTGNYGLAKKYPFNRALTDHAACISPLIESRVCILPDQQQDCIGYEADEWQELGFVDVDDNHFSVWSGRGTKGILTAVLKRNDEITNSWINSGSSDRALEVLGEVAHDHEVEVQLVNDEPKVNSYIKSLLA